MSVTFTAEVQQDDSVIVYGPLDSRTGTEPIREQFQPELVAAIRAVVRDEVRQQMQTIANEVLNFPLEKLDMPKVSDFGMLSKSIDASDGTT